MARLQWDTKDQPKYQSGVSQGVFYNENGEGIPWSGLISVAEKPQANAPTPIYSSTGVKYQHHGNKAEKKSGVSCYMYPEEMDEYLGYEVLDDYGYLADERPPKPFHMAYRVERGNDHYEIHVLLNQIATFNESTYTTISDNPALTTIGLNLEGVPDPKFKTSHLVLDSRLPITQSAEKLLFGTEYANANINNFINAEPVWEDVAINYAPVVEPDYDNMVWLGEAPENFVYDPTKPRPTNYVPGLKKLTASNNNSANTIAYYDEINKCMAVYNKTSTPQAAEFDFKDYPEGAPVQFSACIRQNERDGSNNEFTGQIELVEPATGVKVVDTLERVVKTPPVTLTGDRKIRFYNGQPEGTATVSYHMPFITTAGYTGKFFDANTKDVERGNRFKRVITTEYDYTIHQQLRLRSMSTVLLTDITPWWYTLQASDSQLQLNGGVFTFTGPQAEVYEDETFTIDDSIYG